MKKKMYLYGDRVYLRKLKRSDINKNYLSWLKDPEVTRYLDAGTMSVTKRNMLDYYANFQNNRNDFLFAIITKKDNRHIGNVRLGPIEWVHRRSEFGIMIGGKKSWGQGFASEAIRILLRYAFRVFNLNRINIYIVEENKPALALYKKAGFKIEGCLRGNFRKKGQYLNTLIMGILKKDFIDHGDTQS
jgi:RimJ/RimL family protein N-acetyltransferase